MALNEARNWAGEVANISTGPGGSVKDAFRHGKAQKVLVRAGTRIYKFNEYSTPAAPGSTELSPWWSPWDPWEHDAGWEARTKMAAHFGVSIRELGRLTSVIREDWNSLSFLLSVELAEDVYAFWGEFAGMARIAQEAASRRITTAPGGSTPGFVPEAKGGSGGLPGSHGVTQFYIPGLLVGHVKGAKAESLLES